MKTKKGGAQKAPKKKAGRRALAVGTGSASVDLFAAASLDAEKWGDALNAAAWEMIDAYRTHMKQTEPALFFNMSKTMLRQCIIKFLSEVERASALNNRDVPTSTNAGEK